MDTNSKRIAINTLLLYIRRIFILLISLYTVRLVIEALGIIDYGIFNVVGGVVLMFTFLSDTMSSAIQRFFSIELGRHNYKKLNQVFNLSLIIFSLISFFAFILSETIGLWFLNTQLSIPSNRLNAANWIFQFSIFSFVITILTIPFNALIIAHENLKVFAYIGMIEATLKLLVVFALLHFRGDKLSIYGFLIFITTFIVSILYIYYCKRKYRESKLLLFWDLILFKKLLGFSGWNMFGGVAYVLNSQGINVLLNIFFGPVVNAARGIAFQISSAVNQFVLNFSTAVNPQIIKYYAIDEKDKMTSLAFKGSKYSFFMLLILSIPVLLETHYLLGLWLTSLPKYVILFSQLVLMNALIDSLSYSLQTIAQATGKIKFYQIIVGGMLLLNLPTSLIFLYSGFPPEVTIYISIIISIICLFLRLLLLKNLADISIQTYYEQVLKKIIRASLLASLLPLSVHFLMEESIYRFLMVGLISVFSTICSIYLLGLNYNERLFVKNKIQSYLGIVKI